MVKMDDIIAELMEGTRQNRVPWKTSAGERNFIAAFGNLSVLISSEGTNRDATIKLAVLDEVGDEIDHVMGNRISFNSKYQLPELYAAAKRCALGTDRKLAELMTRIKAAPPISSS